MPNELKPIIRHCKNCAYFKSYSYGEICNGTCIVKYKLKNHNKQRISALLCRFYKEKVEG